MNWSIKRAELYCQVSGNEVMSTFPTSSTSRCQVSLYSTLFQQASNSTSPPDSLFSSGSFTIPSLSRYCLESNGVPLVNTILSQPRTAFSSSYPHTLILASSLPFSILIHFLFRVLRDKSLKEVYSLLPCSVTMGTAL